MLSRREAGQRGETLAADYLRRQGYRVLERNYRTSLGELDLVAQDGQEIVFVEVKTRIGGRSRVPEEAVDSAKVARLERLAEAYLVDARREDTMWRIDVVAIVLDPGGLTLRLDHLRNAVY